MAHTANFSIHPFIHSITISAYISQLTSDDRQSIPHNRANTKKRTTIQTLTLKGCLESRNELILLSLEHRRQLKNLEKGLVGTGRAFSEDGRSQDKPLHHNVA